MQCLLHVTEISQSFTALQISQILYMHVHTKDLTLIMTVFQMDLHQRESSLSKHIIHTVHDLERTFISSTAL